MERYLKISARRGGQTSLGLKQVSDLPCCAVSKVAFRFLERRSVPSSKEGIGNPPYLRSSDPIKLTSVLSSLSSRARLQIRLHERLQITIKNAIHIPNFYFRAGVLREPIWLQHIRSDLAAECDIHLAVFDCLRIRFLLIHLDFKQARAQN